jgi:hypothetical protein
MDAHERAAVERRIVEIEETLDGLPRPLSRETVGESIGLQRELGDLLRALNRPGIVKRPSRSSRLARQS